MTEIRAVLFDLDGTLLPHDYDALEPKIFAGYVKYFAEALPGVNILPPLLRALQTMLNNDGSNTNEDCFWQAFEPLVAPHTRASLTPLFLDFYATRFPALRGTIAADPAAASVVEACRARGARVVLATNPVFPRVAVEERARWAAVDLSLFDHVSCLEDAAYCKPSPGYYRELTRRIDVTAEQCLMVGNDVEMDLRPARAAGMRTVLVDNAFQVKKGEPFAPDHVVPLAAVPSLLG